MTHATWDDRAPTPETDRLFRRFVCRVSGAATDGVDAMRAGRTLEAVHALAEAEQRTETLRERVSEVLFAAIGAAGDDGAARKTLLRARRELFNLRPLPQDALDAACAQLAPDAAEAVRALQAALAERGELARAAEQAYAEESGRARAEFRALLRDPDFRKGLLVSSRSLHASLDRYVKAGDKLSGRDEKTERGLLRYYTRMAMKATPFAAFCAVVPGRFEDAESTEATDSADAADGSLIKLEGDPTSKRSFVRINKLLYGILLDHLKERPSVRRLLVVEANPTMRTEGARLVFLSAVQGREVFQRVPANEVLQVILGMFQRHAAPTLGQLIDELVGDPQIEATPEEATAYLDKLIEIGFLRFHTGIREQDADWDAPFRALLDAMDDDQARQSSELLRVVREKTDAYAVAPVEERERIVGEIHAAIDAAFEAMEVKGRLRKDMPFYEDATAPLEASVALTPGVQRAAAALERWARVTSRLAWPRAEQATMRHFFDQQYGESGGVPLLKFYEDFYREHFKAHVEKEQKARAGVDKEALKDYDVGNPFGLDFIKRLNEGRNRLQEVVVSRWRAAEAEGTEEVTIALAEVEDALRDVEPQPAPCRSVSAFSNLVPPREEGGDPAFLLQGGSYTAGYGKYFSRFLYMLPDEMVEEVRAGNDALTGELLAEICGDAQFNANLHPPLLRWEISYPTGESGAAGDQLLSSDLFVEPDPEDPHSLCLRHGPSGRRVVPVDLGFLNPRMRPPLYQLLSRFTPPVTFAPTIPESLPNPRPAKDEAAPVEARTEDGDTVASPTVDDTVVDDTVNQPPPAPAPSVAHPAADAPAAESPAIDAPAADAASVDKAEAPAGEQANASSEEKPAGPPPKIVHRPRISIDGRVLLTRRRWLVPGVLLPQRGADESAAAFFVRVNRWRAEAGVPESCYLRVIPLPDLAQKKAGEAQPEQPDAQEAAMNVGADAPPAAEEAEAPEAAAQPAAEGAQAGEAGAEEAKGPPKKVTTPSRDFYKPQFMDFGNPLLAGLLGKIGSGLKHFNVVFEERLPERAALPRVKGQAYAAELVIQLNFPEGTAADEPAAAAAEEATVA